MERWQGGQYLIVTAWALSNNADVAQGDPVYDDEDQITCTISSDGLTYVPLDDASNGGADGNPNPTPAPAGTNRYRFPILPGELDAKQTDFAPVSSTLGVYVIVNYEASNVVQTHSGGGARVESFQGSTNAVFMLSRATRGMATFEVVSTSSGPPQTIRANPEVPLTASTVVDFYKVNGKPRLLSFTDEAYLAEITGSSELSGDVVFAIAPIDASLMPNAGDKLIVK